jgi:hypothetical protein
MNPVPGNRPTSRTPESVERSGIAAVERLSTYTEEWELAQGLRSIPAYRVSQGTWTVGPSTVHTIPSLTLIKGRDPQARFPHRRASRTSPLNAPAPRKE